MGERGKTHAWRNAHHVSISRRLCFFIPDDESPADATWKPKGRAPSGEICKHVAQKGSCDGSHWSWCCEWVLMLDKAHKGTHRNVLFLEKQTITFGKWTECSECAWQQTVDWDFLLQNLATSRQLLLTLWQKRLLETKNGLVTVAVNAMWTCSTDAAGFTKYTSYWQISSDILFHTVALVPNRPTVGEFQSVKNRVALFLPGGGVKKKIRIKKKFSGSRKFFSGSKKKSV
jgi:hypothetical protein